MDKDSELKERALAELYANRDVRFHLDIGIFEMISVIGALQLALRHPKYTGPSTLHVRAFIEMARAQFDGMPAIQEGIKSEDDPYPDWKLRKRAGKPL